MVQFTPLPQEMARSRAYGIRLRGKDGWISAEAYECRVSAMPFNREWPGKQRPLEQTELSAWCFFRMDEPVELELLVEEPFSEAVIRPLSRGVTLCREGQKLRFTLDRPGFFTVELDGIHRVLQLFACPFERYDVEKDAPGVLYYAAGMHTVGDLRLKSGQTLFLEDGAVLRGGVAIDQGANVRILGGGVIDNSREERENSLFKMNAPGCVKAMRSSNIELRGPVLLDSAVWTASFFGCDNVLIEQIKAVGMWRYNSDGIDLCNCTNCVVRDCYLRCFDDVIVLKGLKGWDERNVENITVSGCVLWCDWGRSLEIGAETCADHYRNILFRDCDLIHSCHMNMDLHCGDRADVHDILFEDIRVEYSRHTLTPVYQSSDEMTYDGSEGWMPQLFYSCHYCGRWSQDNIMGKSHDIHFRNITVYTDEGLPLPPSGFNGADEEHLCSDITIRRLQINGRALQSDADYPMSNNAFAQNIHVLP